MDLVNSLRLRHTDPGELENFHLISCLTVVDKNTLTHSIVIYDTVRSTVSACKRASRSVLSGLVNCKLRRPIIAKPRLFCFSGGQRTCALLNFVIKMFTIRRSVSVTDGEYRQLLM